MCLRKVCRTTNEFYRILRQSTQVIQGLAWKTSPNPVETYGRPSTTWFIKGEQSHSLIYSPLSAVASVIDGGFVGVDARHLNAILGLKPAVFQKIFDATYQRPGYSLTVRRKLLEACRLPYHGPSS